jgi:hypothetical protein
MVYANIPASHTDPSIRIAQIIPEQMMNETVDIYEDALPYIRCEIQSTIQHESGHRTEEESRTQAGERGEQVMSFEEFSGEGRAEPVAEKEEEDCQPPQEMSGRTVSVDLNQVFEEAKSAANLPPAYRRDVKAGTLDTSAQGMYLMQDFPTELALSRGRTSNAYEGFDGTLWVDVRKIAQPFIAPRQSPEDQRKTHPSTFQDDGATADVPGVSREVPAAGAISAVPAVPETGAQ